MRFMEFWQIRQIHRAICQITPRQIQPNQPNTSIHTRFIDISASLLDPLYIFLHPSQLNSSSNTEIVALGSGLSDRLYHTRPSYTFPHPKSPKTTKIPLLPQITKIHPSNQKKIHPIFPKPTAQPELTFAPEIALVWGLVSPTVGQPLNI